MNPSRAQTPSSQPSSNEKYHHVYFSPAEIEYLSEKQRGKLSTREEERHRSNACGVLELIASRMGFPRKTVATAQSLYHRFFLLFPAKDFQPVDVSLATLYVSAKMHDTLKKPREILAVWYDVQVKLKNPTAELDIDSVDPQKVEADRQKLLAIERLVLESICFNFTSRMPFPYVIKFGKLFRASKKLTKLAWRLTSDSHRTLLSLIYPPHVVALGSILTAALLLSFQQPESPDKGGASSSHEIAALLGRRGEWERRHQAQVEDLETIAHTLLDLLSSAAVQNPSANASPRTPSSPSPYPSPRNQYLSSSLTTPTLGILFKPDLLTKLKIAMRQTEHTPRPRQPLIRSGDLVSQFSRDDSVGLGRNEGTVRFLFGPPKPEVA